MSQFNNVTLVKAANVYFDGKVSSRTVQFNDGSHKTLGLMLPGEYEFGTQAKELMEIMSGELQIMLPESHTWQSIVGPQSFEARESPDNCFYFQFSRHAWCYLI
ncbi:protein of unknown function DUF1255 [Shewanella denitrificans OS217]|uniref:Pyrimidine/purine nucleoside phosphorylase n=1 Tax=Shewanella denitrificans (strain OS217 / ATCC BAA-1090 / DSM 15013) TaxID=318161 RepID=PPNP_SHEDO|nr:pyrimidine/purine nucleoside phosphorylase [Shewanella denitrificans]Q12P69.1 RecName: Full=Pyrimidine/purine nucleoside phosphorylase; AltName: Full=Adenosine phosphorylase; AltName: Full=Cytidine phosphorylase; AltName: Full=Guanosine phosphorylase; AltName: Full=Inosine phosphorylase; AltName: Full=Thymidine phosphorylase; AltName: Full=Uridine phosphorylase; AltName: Full=Xanthosine phosphorylase [Shewanella denitrificans OS217]ABE54757.1 protein of unknown function DUF1255 [Shewanella den